MDENSPIPAGIPIESDLEGDLFSIGLRNSGITTQQVQNISRFIEDTYSITRTENSVVITNDAERHLRGAVFAFGSKGKNDEWKEHTASSLREMVYAWYDGDNGRAGLFQSYKKHFTDFDSLEEKDKSRAQALCMLVSKIFYKYFSAITHHNPSEMISGYRTLSGVHKQFPDCIDDASFTYVVKRFFSDVQELMGYIPTP